MSETPSSCKVIDLADLPTIVGIPQPMFVALVGLEGVTEVASAPVREVERRLREKFRSIDEIYSLLDGRYVIVLRASVDVGLVGSRMNHLFETLNLPYVVDGIRAQHRAILGGAIRGRDEAAEKFVARVSQAFDESASALRTGMAIHAE